MTDNHSQARIQNLVNLVKAYRERKSSGDFMPIIYAIDPTNICNYDCIMCPTQKIPRCEKGFMEFGLFCNIVDQISSVAKTVLLYNMGEPLLHPKIVEMVAYLRKNAIKTVISTNVSRLNPEIGEALLKAGLDEIILCIDGNSAETYEQIRRRGKFDAVVKNTQKFLEIAKDYPSTVSYIQMISMHINQHEQEGFLNYWSQYNCIPLVTWFDTWARQLPELENLSDQLCPNTAINRRPCADLWFKMAINCNGKVVLCVQDWSYSVILGDANTQSIKAIWQSDKIIKLRNSQLESNYDLGICKNCNDWCREEEEFEYFKMTHLEKQSTGYDNDPVNFILAGAATKKPSDG